MKRFTETDKWNDTWFSSLNPTQKYVFMYLIDVCDNAGFYELNYRKMEFDLGLTKDKIEAALKGLARGLYGALEIIWIKNFLRHQKNLPLNNSNPAHRQIIRLIEFKLEWLKTIKEGKELEGALKGLLSPIGTGTGKGTGKKGGSGEKKGMNFYDDELIIIPENSEWKDAYIAFVNFLKGDNETGKEATHILKVPEQLSFQQFVKVYTQCEINGIVLKDLFDSMLNNHKYTKDKQSLSLTLQNWIRNNSKK